MGLPDPGDSPSALRAVLITCAFMAVFLGAIFWRVKRLDDVTKRRTTWAFDIVALILLIASFFQQCREDPLWILKHRSIQERYARGY